MWDDLGKSSLLLLLYEFFFIIVLLFLELFICILFDDGDIVVVLKFVVEVMVKIFGFWSGISNGMNVFMCGGDSIFEVNDSF